MLAKRFEPWMTHSSPSSLALVFIVLPCNAERFSISHPELCSVIAKHARCGLSSQKTGRNFSISTLLFPLIMGLKPQRVAACATAIPTSPRATSSDIKKILTADSFSILLYSSGKPAFISPSSVSPCKIFCKRMWSLSFSISSLTGIISLFTKFLTDSIIRRSSSLMNISRHSLNLKTSLLYLYLSLVKRISGT